MTPSRAAGERPGSFALGALVFGAGIGALATEITASRLLAPYFGSSTVVWANLIGIVLAALALGYWLGGRLADRRPEPPVLGYVVLAGALCIAVIPFAARPFLDVTVEGLDTASAASLRLRVPSTSLNELKIHQIRKILRDHPGDSAVYLHIGHGKILRLADEFCVDLDRAVGELRMLLGHDAVML